MYTCLTNKEEILMSKQSDACDEVIKLLRSTEEGARLDDLRRLQGISIAFRQSATKSFEPLAMIFNPAACLPRGEQKGMTILLSPNHSAADLVEPLKREIRNLNIKG